MLQQKLVTIAGKCADQKGRFFTSKPSNKDSSPKSMLKFWDFMLVMITPRHCPEKGMPSKWKKFKFKKRSLNDYLSNLYLNIKAEQSNLKLSFATFAKMGPSNYVLANFMNRQSSLCKKHQNVTLKLKMLKNYNKTVLTNPDIFIKTFFQAISRNSLTVVRAIRPTMKNGKKTT